MDTNVIYCGDNLEVLPKYVPDESVDLIYIDLVDHVIIRDGRFVSLKERGVL